jgi:hypothetical protein
MVASAIDPGEEFRQTWLEELGCNRELTPVLGVPVKCPNSDAHSPDGIARNADRPSPNSHRQRRGNGCTGDSAAVNRSPRAQHPQECRTPMVRG